jgi:hypothetical protein
MVMVDLNSFYSETRRKIAEEMKRLPPTARFYSSLEKQIPMLMDKSDHRDFVSDCPCHICNDNENEKVQKTAIFDKYDNITRKNCHTLTDHQYFLCAKQIYAFVFKTRTWGKQDLPVSFLRQTNRSIEKVHVRNLSLPRFHKDMIENLVMDEARLKILKSLTGSFARLNRHGQALSEKPWAADYVDGKGNGLIFLLHCGPGVGKTFTAGKFCPHLESL